MKRVFTIAAAGITTMLLALTIGVAAQDFNPSERSFITFSAPVELPGVMLPAGTYVFRLADTQARNVVQVLSQDEKEVMGQWTFVQAERPEVSGETVVTFKETREGATPAVQYWYYPGEKVGKEFIYPRDQAMRIAARTGATVKSDEGEITAADATQATVSTQAEASQAPAPAQQAQTPAPQPQAEASASVQTPAGGASASGAVQGRDLPADVDANADANRAVGTSGQAGVNANANIRQESTQAAAELPATASPLALSGLLGLLALMGAAGVRYFRQ